MRKLISPTNHHQLSLDPIVNRNDNVQSHTIPPILMETGLNQVEDFPKDFFPTIAKKYSSAPHIYKHVFVTSPSKIIMHKKPKNKKSIRKEDSWFDSLNPFGCDSDYDDDYEEDYSESDEFLTKRKSKLKYKKKKKKKILVKILLGLLVFFAAKCLLYKFSPTFFPTTGRDELYPDNDQLYDGIELDRTNDWSKAQEIEVEHRSIFPPGYDETRIKEDLSLKQKLKGISKNNKKQKMSNIKAKNKIT